MKIGFIIVENIDIDIYIATELIKRMVGEVDIETFVTADAALNYITLEKAPAADRHIILLDLMLPRMHGSNFISLFEELPDHIKDSYQIAIVTSSMNKGELERLSKRPNVEMIIEKPLTRRKFKSFLEKINIPIAYTKA
ncbi:MAG: response regulator [Bacteroidetes bacterium]|nr:response regulator [Bacteroidota bacterium]